jgi:hypothetical protein
MIFRDGIKPMWEDEANSRGGKWSLKLKKGVASHFWEEMVRDHIELSDVLYLDAVITSRSAAFSTHWRAI